MPNILVTGGAGYVGSHACKALAKAGFTPVCYDNLSRGHRWAVKWGTLEEGDILDGDRLRDVIGRHDPVAVLHFAAFAYVGESVSQPDLYYRNNVGGSMSLLGAVKDTGIDKFVFSSTCAIFGEPETVPITEDHPKAPINPYGRSKLMIEDMLGDYGAAFGLRSVSLRYFNAAGADGDGEIGEAHDPESHLIPLIFDAASQKSDGISVFGDDYDTPDGTCIRDYIHVTDLADAHVLALKKLLSGFEGGVFNLGTGQGYSVREVIDKTGEVTGCDIPLTHAPRRAGDPPRLVADCSLARKVLGWEPARQDIGTIIEDAWRWYRNRP